jgi:t-SNARE complex subunit (syntaxin)
MWTVEEYNLVRKKKVLCWEILVISYCVADQILLLVNDVEHLHDYEVSTAF